MAWCSNPPGDISHRASGRRADAAQLKEAVDHPEVSLAGAGYALLCQPLIQRFAFITQRVVFRGDDMHRRQAAEIISPERAGFWMLCVGVGKIQFITRKQRISRNDVVFAVTDVARATGGGIEHRVNQQQLCRRPLPYGFQS